jgi:hypothetical protein
VGDRRDEPGFHDFDDEAIDLALVHADDEYLDMLSGARLDDGELDEIGDDQLSRLLMSWRQDVDSEPIDELVDTKLATVTVHAARMQRKRRPRLLVPIAAAAAVLAIAFAGVGLAARDAQPGDTLWALTKVLYAEHARSIEAAQAVKNDLREAKAALTEGNIEVAKSKLEAAHEMLPTVLPDDGQNDLADEHASLLAQLPGNPADQAGSPPSPEPSTQQPGAGSSDSTSDNNSSGSDSSQTLPPETSQSSPDETTGTSPTTTSTETSPRSEEGSEPAGTGNEPGNAPAGETP